MQFIITKAELAKAASDTGFRLMVVTKNLMVTTLSAGSLSRL
jgi:hypothetical protein